MRRPEANQQQQGKRLTGRDLEILDFINQFGFCEMPHIQARFGLKKARGYQLLKKLRAMGLVHHEPVFAAEHGTFRLTAKGAKHTCLPPIDGVPVGIYCHQTSVIEVFLKLRGLYPHAGWVSGRQLQQEKFYDGVGKYGHLADGVLALSREEHIAIEVELSLKGKGRLEHILKGYAKADFKEVWYFCAPNILPNLKSATARFSYVKIHNIQEFLKT
jgi:hypothetical protein